jgi:DNA repair protein RecO
LCLKLLPLWQKNFEIFQELEKLAGLIEDSQKIILKHYTIWELNFLKNLGYGLNFDKCAVTGVKENIFFLSPKSGNAVCYSVGKKYQKRLFKIPEFFKKKSCEPDLDQIYDALRISGHFFETNCEQNIGKLIFRNQLISKVKNL